MPALSGAILVLAATHPHGVGLTADSAGFLCAARNLAAGVGAVIYSGGALTTQPPLYPALLALLQSVLGVDPQASASVVNALTLALTVYLSGLWILQRQGRSRTVAWLGAVSILAAGPLLQISMQALSEPLFALLVVVFLLSMEAYVRSGDTTALVAVSLAASEACLTRYVGLTLVLTGGLCILLLRRDRLQRRAMHLAIFGLVSCVPIGMWLLRNWIVGRTLFGLRGASPYALPQTVGHLFDTLMSWYAPWMHAGRPAALALAGAGAVLLALLVSRGGLRKVLAALARVGPGALFSAVYVAFLAIASTTAAYDAVDSRLLSPIFVPATVVSLSLAEGLLDGLKGRWARRAGIAVLAACLAAWLLCAGRQNARWLANFAEQGADYGTAWRHGQTLEYVQGLPSTYPIYSNAPDGIYVVTRRLARTTPSETRYNSTTPVQALSSLRGMWPEEGRVYLVWFDTVQRSFLFSLDRLLSVVQVEQEVRFSDGAAYLVSRQ